MTQTDRLSLDQLERRSGVPSRQIRELIRLGVLPAPSSRGRGATYGPEHVERLRAWRRLRRESPPGTTNEQLRVLVDRLHSAGLLKGIADGTVPFALVDDARGEVTIRGPQEATGAKAPPKVNEDALSYLSKVRSTPPAPARVALHAVTFAPTLEVDLRAAHRSGAGLALDRLRTALEEYVSRNASPPRVNPPRSESWHRVTVGRDVEIAARGELTPDELQLLETVGQLLQQAIYRKEN